MTAVDTPAVDVLMGLTPREFDAVLVMIAAAFRDALAAEANLREVRGYHDRALACLQAAERTRR